MSIFFKNSKSESIGQKRKSISHKFKFDEKVFRKYITTKNLLIIFKQTSRKYIYGTIPIGYLVQVQKKPSDQ